MPDAQFRVNNFYNQLKHYINIDEKGIFMSNYLYDPQLPLLKNLSAANVGSCLWDSTDSLVRYEQNGANVPENYRNVDIHYVYNSLGYRCKEINEFKDGEFLLALGCSYTQGIGLHQTEIWCERLSQMLDVECMNVGAEGSGVELSLYNTVMYTRAMQKGLVPKPKYVCVQHSHMEREAKIELVDHNFGDRHDLATLIGTGPERNKMLSPPDYDIPFQMGMYMNVIVQIWNSLNIPIVCWTYDGDFGNTDYAHTRVISIPKDHNVPFNYDSDKARDCTHNGPSDNFNVARNLLNAFNYLQETNTLCLDKNFVWPKQLSDEEKAKQKIIEQRNRTNIIYN